MVKVSIQKELHHCSVKERESYPAIDACRNRCHVVWPVDDIFDLTLQLGVQFAR